MAAEPNPVPGAGPPADRLLEVEALRAVFHTAEGPAEAVSGVGFTVERGEAVGLVGESGCGKSTTALSLLGLLPPGTLAPGSSIRLEGQELVDAGPASLRRVRGRRVAMVFQDPIASLNPVMPVGEQVAEVLRLHPGMGRSAARGEARALLEEVGLPRPHRLLDEHPHQLSGGMAQRVGIAMALAGRPELLVADEPTAALDVTVQAQILQLLARLRRERGMALLLVSHDLDVVARVCDRLLVMYAGEIVESGPTELLFSAPRHPYTRALLDARPRMDGPQGMVPGLEGAPPSPLRWPGGCRLRPRCPHARLPGCAEVQKRVELEAGRTVRCGRHQALGPLEAPGP